MKTRSSILASLALAAPCLSIAVLWEDDIHPDTSIFDKGNALDDQSPDDWRCWMSEVRASMIVNGQLLTGSDYLGGTWEKASCQPDESNPEISGYFPQMCEQALEDLHGQVAALDLHSKPVMQALNALEAALALFA